MTRIEGKPTVCTVRCDGCGRLVGIDSARTAWGGEIWLCPRCVWARRLVISLIMAAAVAGAVSACVWVG
jgi:hypothetical protein